MAHHRAKNLLRKLNQLLAEMKQAYAESVNAEIEAQALNQNVEGSDFIEGARLVTRHWHDRLDELVRRVPPDDSVVDVRRTLGLHVDDD